MTKQTFQNLLYGNKIIENSHQTLKPWIFSKNSAEKTDKILTVAVNLDIKHATH